MEIIIFLNRFTIPTKSSQSWGLQDRPAANVAEMKISSQPSRIVVFFPVVAIARKKEEITYPLGERRRRHSRMPETGDDRLDLLGDQLVLGYWLLVVVLLLRLLFIFPLQKDLSAIAM